MSLAAILQPLRAFPAMCRPDGSVAAAWLAKPDQSKLWAAFCMILLGGGLYGYSLGVWRAPEMGWYVGVKLPMLLVLVTLCNGLLNGMVAQLLGANLSFRQSLLSTLLSFALFSLILGSLSPLILALAWSLEGPFSNKADTAYAALLTLNVLAIAMAGILSHSRFLPALISTTGNAVVARRVFFTWLGGNLFVGAQLSWNLRPFFGHPSNPTTFLRENWNDGNFYETVGLHLNTLVPDLRSRIFLGGLLLAVIAWKFMPSSPSTPSRTR